MNRQTSSLKNYKKLRNLVEDMPMAREKKEALWGAVEPDWLV